LLIEEIVQLDEFKKKLENIMFKIYLVLDIVINMIFFFDNELMKDELHKDEIEYGKNILN